MNNMQLKKGLILIILLSTLLIGCGVVVTSSDYKDTSPTVPTIHSCYMCGSDEVYVNDYRWGFWIECENCHFKTGNFENYDELVNKWNNIKGE